MLEIQTSCGVAQGSGGVEPDPILDAISAYRTAHVNLDRLHSTPNIFHLTDEFEAESSRLGAIRIQALERVYETAPHTPAGLLALVRVFMVEDLPAMSGIEAEGAEAICRAVLTILT